MNKYTTLKNRQQEEINAFPMFFAFSKEQFIKAMEKRGLTEKDTNKIVSIGAGGYILKSDVPAFKELVARHKREREEAMASDKTGNGYIYEMFYYELNNHEYSYTMDYGDTLTALGLSYDDLIKDKRLHHAIEKAAAKIRETAVDWC